MKANPEMSIGEQFIQANKESMKPGYQLPPETKAYYEEMLVNASPMIKKLAKA